MVQMNEDLQTLTGTTACSIAYRNAIFKVVPKALWNGVYEEAMRVAKGDAATLVQRRDAAVKYFHDLKVTDEQICAALELERVEDIDLEKLAVLTSYRSALKNEEATLEALFPPIVPNVKAKAAGAAKATEDKLKGKGAAATASKVEQALKTESPQA
jgi:hypothetical protein